MSVAEEMFGPALSVIPFDDEVEAIRIANDIAFGLAAWLRAAPVAKNCAPAPCG